jgi:hypothetical protein
MCYFYELPLCFEKKYFMKHENDLVSQRVFLTIPSHLLFHHIINCYPICEVTLDVTTYNLKIIKKYVVFFCHIYL